VRHEPARTWKMRKRRAGGSKRTLEGVGREGRGLRVSSVKKKGPKKKGGTLNHRLEGVADKRMGRREKAALLERRGNYCPQNSSSLEEKKKEEAADLSHKNPTKTRSNEKGEGPVEAAKEWFRQRLRRRKRLGPSRKFLRWVRRKKEL